MPQTPPPLLSLSEVRAEIGRLGPRDAYRSLIASNDALIRSPDLGGGREIAAARTAIHVGLMAHWAEEQQAAFGYERPFAVVALGGTGRAEMAPCSDTDFAFLFDDEIDGNPFLLELQRQLIHSGAFRERCGFSGEVMPFNLDDMPAQEGKGLNAFLDMQPVYDPDGLAGQFRDRLRASCDPFEHFLHLSRFWRDRWGESDARPEQVGKFDIKSDGLRVFLAGVWSLASSEFRHSHEIYAEIPDPRILGAYDLLLRIRAFIHLRRGTRNQPSTDGSHLEDVMVFEDFTAFGELLGEGSSERRRFEFANEVRGQLLTARRRLERFTWGVIGGILKQGRPIQRDSAIVYGTGGLRDSAPARDDDRAKSRAALGVLLAAQRHELPVDPAEMEATFRDAGDWLQPVPELSALFREARGSLAKSLEILSGLPGAGGRLFPGFEAFESSIDRRVLAEGKVLRGALARQKLGALERAVEKGRSWLDGARNPGDLADTTTGVSFPIEAAMLEPGHLAAIRLALYTKRLPVTPSDLHARDDESLPLHRRFSSGFSGIALTEYYESSFAAAGFDEETLSLAQFLVGHRRLFKDYAANDLMGGRLVDGLVAACGKDESRLRSLFVFTCADRTDWEGEQEEPARWFNIRELYGKAIRRFRPGSDPRRQLVADGFAPGELEILEDFGRSFFGGGYSQYARRYGSHLLNLAESAPGGATPCALPPRVEKLRIGTSEVIAIATRDHPGIAASISGALWKSGVALSQAHLFSARNHGIALDFFHLAPDGSDEPPVSDAALAAAVREAIVDRLYIGAADEVALPAVATNITLDPTASGHYHLRAETGEDIGGLIYFLACKAHRLLGADIYGLAAHTGGEQAWVSVYLGLPDSMSLEEAREIVAGW